MEKIRTIILLLCLSVGLSAMALTAENVVAKAAAQANAAKGVTCRFAVSGGGVKSTGTLIASGNRFRILSNSSNTWYNGRNMWIFNPSVNETTLVTPTAAELSESNPMLYLKTYRSNFNCSFSKRKAKGVYIVNLTPKSKKHWLSNVEIEIDSRSFKPKKFVMTPKNGQRTVLSVSSIDYSAPHKAAEFEYPKSKYPKVEIVDLR